MPLTKNKTGSNMYPWVSHVHSHLAGVCPHGCDYCYAQDIEHRWKTGRYAGPLRIVAAELDVPYGKGKTIFIEHMNDLLAKEIPNTLVNMIIMHCMAYPDNTYVFQTKNPARYKGFTWPQNCIRGTTIESDIHYPEIMGNAPSPAERMLAMETLGGRKFVTIEPVLDFDVETLALWIARIRPEFLNLGADSKRHGLPEPTVEKIMALVAKLKEFGIDLREKSNLQRLKPK